MFSETTPRATVHILLMGAQEDRKLHKQLESHIHVLERTGWIKSWTSYDSVLPGNDWRLVVAQHLQQADVIVLLMTINFVGSDEHYMHEMLPALARHRTGQAQVVPVLLRSLSLDSLPLAGLPVLPTDARGGVKPVDLWSNKSLVWTYVFEGIKKVVRHYTVRVPVSNETQTIWSVPPRHHSSSNQDREVNALRHTFLQQREEANALSPMIQLLDDSTVDTSELALAYAYHHRSNYRIVFWLNATSREQLTLAYIDLALLADLPEKNDQDLDTLIAAVKRWLGQQRSWLLIFEVGEDKNDLENLLPASGPGHILITTPAHDAHTVAAATEETFPKTQVLLSWLQQQSGGQYRDASNLLRLCAYLDGFAIPTMLLRIRPAVLSPRLRQCIDDDTRLQQVLKNLVSWEFIDYDQENSTIHIARTIQDALKASLSASSQRAWFKRALLLCDRAFPEPDVEAWPLCQSYLPHVLHCAHLLETEAIDEPAVPGLLERAGRYLHARGLFTDALKLYTQALARVEHDTATQQEVKAQLWHDLGSLHRSLGQQENYRSSAHYFELALSLRQQLFGEQSAQVAQTLSALGELYQTQEHFLSAEDCYSRALSIRHQALLPADPAIAASLADLAGIYDEQGQYAQAESYYLQARASYEHISHAVEHQSTDTARLYGNMARLYRVLGRYQQAEELYLRALAIYERVLGPQHRSVAVILNNCAFLYRCMHRYPQACRMAARAIRIWLSVFGPHHPDTVAGCNTLAKIYSDQGAYERADHLFSLVLAFREQRNAQSTSTAQVLDYLGENELRLGHLPTAQQYLFRALSIRESVLGEMHIDTATTLSHIAQLYRTMQDADQADVFYLRALALYDRLLGDFSATHPDVLACQQEYAAFLQTRGH